MQASRWRPAKAQVLVLVQLVTLGLAVRILDHLWDSCKYPRIARSASSFAVLLGGLHTPLAFRDPVLLLTLDALLPSSLRTQLLRLCTWRRVRTHFPSAQTFLRCGSPSCLLKGASPLGLGAATHLILERMDTPERRGAMSYTCMWLTAALSVTRWSHQRLVPMGRVPASPRQMGVRSSF